VGLRRRAPSRGKCRGAHARSILEEAAWRKGSPHGDDIGYLKGTVASWGGRRGVQSCCHVEGKDGAGASVCSRAGGLAAGTGKKENV
jgi:hypothetical protein